MGNKDYDFTGILNNGDNLLFKDSGVFDLIQQYYWGCPNQDSVGYQQGPGLSTGKNGYLRVLFNFFSRKIICQLNGFRDHFLVFNPAGPGMDLQKLFGTQVSKTFCILSDHGNWFQSRVIP